MQKHISDIWFYLYIPVPTYSHQNKKAYMQKQLKASIHLLVKTNTRRVHICFATGIACQYGQTICKYTFTQIFYFEYHIAILNKMSFL